LITCGGNFDSNDTNNLTIMTERQRYDYGHMTSNKVKLGCIRHHGDYGAEYGNFKSFRAVLGRPIQ
jgi:hypothetical protein